MPNIINMQLTPMKINTAAVAIAALTRPSFDIPSSNVARVCTKNRSRPVEMDIISAMNMNWGTRSFGGYARMSRKKAATPTGRVLSNEKYARTACSARSSLGHRFASECLGALTPSSGWARLRLSRRSMRCAFWLVGQPASTAFPRVTASELSSRDSRRNRRFRCAFQC